MASLKRVVQVTVNGQLLVSNTKSRTTTGDNFVYERLTVHPSAGDGETEWTIPTDIAEQEVTIQHVGDANYVDIGFATGVYPLRVQPGDSITFDVPATTGSLFFLSDGADADINIVVTPA